MLKNSVNRTYSGTLLDNVAAHPEQQGRGIGKRIVYLAESVARAQGFEKLGLYSDECMEDNVAIYKAPEYTETQRKEEQGCNRVYLQNLLS